MFTKAKALLLLMVVALLASMLGLVSPASAAPASAPALKISTAGGSAQAQAGWDTLDYVFNKSPKTLKSIVAQGDRIAYVGISARPVSTLPLVSFRGKSAGGKLTNHVFVVTKSSKHNSIPAYQYSRLAAMLPACKTEDANLCVWDASKRGNGKGKSFIALSETTTLTKGR